jgi:hypothetical protein
MLSGLAQQSLDFFFLCDELHVELLLNTATASPPMGRSS